MFKLWLHDLGGKIKLQFWDFHKFDDIDDDDEDGDYYNY